MLTKTRIKPSQLSILVVILCCLFIDLHFKNWKKSERVIEYDIHWYYFYLPATFIYDDLELNQSDYQFWDGYSLFWPHKTPEGKHINKTSMGLSMLYAPFFFTAHGLAKVCGYEPNGCSEPYKILLLLSTIFYLFIGLIYMRKILRHYAFSELVIAITLALIGLGTNLLCYSSQSAPMPHAYNFCLFALFFYFTVKWHESPLFKHTIILGLLAGLISLIRPSNIILLLFFALYGVTNFESLKQRFRLFLNKTPLLLLLAALAVLVWVPQFLYWHKITGHYIYYSYTNERFFFNDPKIIDGLFSFRKGWLIYTPVMAFALIGIFFMKEEMKKMRPALIVFMIINIYIIFSWWCWWYGGTFGQRSLIESYALLSVPLAAFVQYLLKKKRSYQVGFAVMAAFLIWLNIFQTFQFENKSLHHDGMNAKLYFKQFGKMDRVEGFDSYVDWPNYEEAGKGNR